MNNTGNKALRPAQISFFNPGRLTDEELELAFVARQKLFRFIFEKIIAEQSDEIPQHLLIIGERGMGKSTLLHRLAVELRKAPHYQIFIPLTFPEEQYNIDRLSKFWLNCLDALADALDRSNPDDVILADLDADIQRWARNGRDIKAAEMYSYFIGYCQRLQRRPVLLVDNLNLALNALKTEEKHALRALLMEKNAPVLVGAGVQVIEETVSYTAPFYDAFQQFRLEKLTFEEAIETLHNLAKITQNTYFDQQIAGNRGRLRALYQLTGGTPRTLTMLYPIIRDGFSENIQTDLEGLMDMATALYKARFEELAPQMQIVLDTVALHWDPIHLEALREITQLDNAQLSPQLKRLQDIGWLHRLDAYGAKGNAYEISERFFNIWYLMRRSTRRRKKELLCLTKFLGIFYGEELPQMARHALNNPLQHPDHVSLHLALADAVKDKKIARKLRSSSYKTLLDWAERDTALLNNFAVPEEFVSEKEKEVFEEARQLMQKNEYEAVVEKLKFLIKLNSKKSTYHALLGFIYFSFKLYNEAEQICQVAIKIDPKDTNVWKLLGVLYQNHLQRYEEAEHAFQKIIELNSRDIGAWGSLGILYQIHLQRYAEAEEAYLKAIEFSTKDADLWLVNLGGLYQNHLQGYAKAEKAYQKAIEVNPINSLAYYNLGYLYQYKMQRYSDAEYVYQKGIEISPNDFDLWNNLALLYQDHLKRFSEAEHAYQKALEIKPTNANLWYNLGHLYQNYSQRFSEAEQTYKKAIELNPNFAYAWNNLGVLYLYDLHRYAEAEQAYLNTISIDATFASPWNGLGCLYQDILHRYSEAEKAYQKALELTQNAEEIFVKHNLIFLYRDKLGQMERAKALFEKLERVSGVEDSWHLQRALFAYYDKNLGFAAVELGNALKVIGSALPPFTKGDWWRFAAAAHRLGYSREVLAVMEKTGHDIVLRPFYEAIKTLAEGSDNYLNSVALEVREPARMILEQIRRIGDL